METFTRLFGSLLLFVYHCFDRVVINGYLSGLSRPGQVVHFFQNVVGEPVIGKDVLSRRTNEYQAWVEAFADVRVTQDVNDKYQLLPGMEGLESRWHQRPKQVVADGDFTTNLSVIQMAKHEIDFFGSWNPGPAGQKRTKPDWRGIHPEFQRDAFRCDSAQDHYVCPAGKLQVFSKANKLPHGGEDRFYKATRADCGPCENRERCCPHYASRGRIITHRVEPAVVTAFKAKMQTLEGKAVYKQRSQVAEFPFAWIKEKLRLRRFHVRGLIKTGMEALWACLTFNIQAWMRFRSKAIATHAG